MHEEDTIKILKSLADETRLSMVRKLAEESVEMPGGEIIPSCSAALKLSQPTMSHHFNKLVESKVINVRKSGVEKYYSLNKELLKKIGINTDKL